MTDLTPREIVSELDRFIIGQKEAKRAVAVALRNRWRRKQLSDDLRDEVYPICSPDYLQAHGPIDDLEQLVRHPLIMHQSYDPVWTGWEAWLSAFGAEMPRPRVPLTPTAAAVKGALSLAVGDGDGPAHPGSCATPPGAPLALICTGASPPSSHAVGDASLCPTLDLRPSPSLPS